MIITIVLICCHHFLVSTIDVDQSVNEEWISFKLNFNKTYGNVPEEEIKRMKIFYENLETIKNHNRRNFTFKMGINKFADLTFEEFSKMNSMSDDFDVPDAAEGLEIFEQPKSLIIPKSFDWRNFHAVTVVKDQKDCGSCYAFAAIGSAEGQIFMKTGKLLSLSEQEIIDCASSDATFGCDGGYLFGVFNYIKQNRGISLEKDFPFSGIKNSCKTDKSKFEVTLKGFVELPSNDEDLLQQALLSIGPLAVLIDINHESFMRYESGIYYEPNCSDNTNHAALLVGYGTENGIDYWTLKNSYSTSYGEKGFLRIARNQNNHCGIASFATFPLI
jgi:cathepsin L